MPLYLIRMEKLLNNKIRLLTEILTANHLVEGYGKHSVASNDCLTTLATRIERQDVHTPQNTQPVFFSDLTSCDF